jgi:hypothetical protein
MMPSFDTASTGGGMASMDSMGGSMMDATGLNPPMTPPMTPPMDPSMDPSMGPSMDPSMGPSMVPPVDPSMDPSIDPSIDPSVDPIVLDPPIDDALSMDALSSSSPAVPSPGDGYAEEYLFLFGIYLLMGILYLLHSGIWGVSIESRTFNFCSAILYFLISIIYVLYFYPKDPGMPPETLGMIKTSIITVIVIIMAGSLYRVFRGRKGPGSVGNLSASRSARSRSVSMEVMPVPDPGMFMTRRRLTS